MRVRAEVLDRSGVDQPRQENNGISEDQTQKFDASESDRLDQIIGMVQGLTSETRAMAAQLRAMDERLTSLEQKVEERIYDTRPLWESVQTQIVELREPQERMNQEQTRIREEMQTGFRQLDHKVALISSEIRE